MLKFVKQTRCSAGRVTRCLDDLRGGLAWRKTCGDSTLKLSRLTHFKPPHLATLTSSTPHREALSRTLSHLKKFIASFLMCKAKKGGKEKVCQVVERELHNRENRKRVLLRLFFRRQEVSHGDPKRFQLRDMQELFHCSAYTDFHAALLERPSIKSRVEHVITVQRISRLKHGSIQQRALPAEPFN
jgi:hypothetical protein